ncbi:unnamed protein product [Prunus brigantina]
MAGSSMGELRAPIFNGSNYDFWRIKMCTIFKSHKLWDMVENGYEEPDVKKEEGETLTVAQKLALEENVAKDAKALGLIQGAVSMIFSPNCIEGISQASMGNPATRIREVIKR